MSDTQRVDAAMSRFRAFFLELKTAFYERDDVLHQLALALLCREHALVTGPPGTAKSALASAVLGRIVCEESGEPSLYSRQITESTVQTDLIGPIDFKNLMATGRSTHFTDEGMLGAVHAFLDEVFDGRDMLLRSALNVLQERELKQGATVTRGRIECALMTSNRYIVDVIESARETLLAFVDRVAFISFVPRGFASPDNMSRVLERHVARASSSRLDALLTLQDLDVLQALVDDVVVSVPICEAIATLIGSLHAEVNQAARADPSFLPTRYFSTRTAVRSGRVLRAQVVLDAIFSGEPRELQVLPKDLETLRLHLLLGGPTPAEVKQLLAQESDANERRQLEIVRIEREIFDRCLARLGRIRVAPLMRAATPPASTPSAPPPPPDPLEGFAARAQGTDAAELVAAIHELTPLVTAGADHAEAARGHLEAAMASLNRVVLRASLEAAAAPGSDLLVAVERLVELAASVGDDTVSMHGVASWLRAEARAMVVAAVHFAGGGAASDLGASLAVDPDPIGRTSRRLEVLDRLAGLRRRVLSSTASAEPDVAWDAAIDVAEQDLAALWDAAFCRRIAGMLAAEATPPLSEMLHLVAPELAWLDEASERLSRIRGTPSALKRRAIGRRLGDLVGARMAVMDGVDKEGLHAEIDKVLALLDELGLELAIVPSDWLSWCAQVMIRSDGAPPPAARDEAPSHAGYTALRATEQRVPVAFSLSEIALRVAPELSRRGVAATDVTPVAELMAELPAALQRRVAATDLERVGRAVGYLESWWTALSAGKMAATARLEAIARSRFFEVLWDDLALARFSLEAELVERLLGEHAAAAKPLRERIEALEARTRRGARALLCERTDEAWAAALVVPQG